MAKEINSSLLEIKNSTPEKIVISNRKNKLVNNTESEAALLSVEKLQSKAVSESIIKIVIQRKVSQKNEFYQAEEFSKTQVFHCNINVDELTAYIENALDSGFTVVDSFSRSIDFNMRISKKGKVLFSGHKRRTDDTPCLQDYCCESAEQSHNRKKNYIIAEGTVVPALVDMGIFTKEGKVVNSMQDKFRQINRFLEVVDNAVSAGKYDSLTVVDFGCGKSYLTFILYYYFTFIKKINVTMIGLDLKEDVIAKCSETAEKYGYENLSFQVGDINGFNYYGNIDMVVTLHACDTATDFALFNAVRWKTKMIFSVPCCQHEVNMQIKSDAFSVLTKYGLIKERISALFTDAMRGSLLEACGYKTQMLEFIDITHTPKNILIRAVKTNVSAEKRRRSLEEVERLCEEFSLDQTLYRLLIEDGLL